MKTIESHIKIIINEILKYIDKDITIILYGSYGRDEGGWYKDKYGNDCPYNDYDILIIYNKYISTDLLNEIKFKIKSQIDIKWIDISVLKEQKLKRLKPTIFNYDLKYGSKIIYGDKNILTKIPNYYECDISLNEIDTLFKTRMWTFLGSLKENFPANLYGDDSRFFRNQMSKALLAIVDVKLILINKYHTSYKTRVKRIKHYYKSDIEFIKLSEWALSEKLNPKDDRMDRSALINKYEIILKYYKETMYYGLSKRYQIFINYKILILLWKYYPINLLKRIVYRFFLFTNHYENNLKMNIIQLYLIESYNNNINLDKCKRLLYKLTGNRNDIIDWHSMRIKVSDLRLY